MTSFEKLQEIFTQVEGLTQRATAVSSDIWFQAGQDSDAFRRVQEVLGALKRLEWALEREAGSKAAGAD